MSYSFVISQRGMRVPVSQWAESRLSLHKRSDRGNFDLRSFASLGAGFRMCSLMLHLSNHSIWGNLAKTNSNLLNDIEEYFHDYS